MKSVAAVFAVGVALSGCAAQTSVQKIGFGYNNAVANLTDQLALLNVVRANSGYPLHYTSLSRLSGSITLKATGAFNAQIKDPAPTDTTSGVNTVASTGTTVANTITHAVTSGGNQYMPSIGGEVDTNPSFDVDVNDTQEFYRGILGSIDPAIIDDLLRQGYDQRELLALTVSGVNFRLSDTSALLTDPKGGVLLSVENRRGDQDRDPKTGRITTDRDQLKVLFGCYRFETVDKKDDAKVLAPLSRIGGSNSGAPTQLTLQDLALLDGSKLDLNQAIDADASKDKDVRVVRPATKKSVGKFTWIDQPNPNTCSLKPIALKDGSNKTVYRTENVPPDRFFAGNGLLFTAASSSPPGTAVTGYVPVDIEMTLRSPEGVIQFVGDCLGAFVNDVATCSLNSVKLFELHKGTGGPGDISVQFRDGHYFIDPTTDGGRASLRTIGLIEKLIDLNKSSADKPVTTPVHVVS